MNRATYYVNLQFFFDDSMKLNVKILNFTMNLSKNRIKIEQNKIFHVSLEAQQNT